MELVFFVEDVLVIIEIVFVYDVVFVEVVIEEFDKF